MEIPLRNAFISKAIKKNQNFMNQFKSNYINNLSSKNESYISKIKSINNNKNNSTIYKKVNIKNKPLKKTKNFSDLCLLKPNKNKKDDLNYTGSCDFTCNQKDEQTQILPKLIQNSSIYNYLDILKIKKANSNQNTFSNEKIKFNENNKKLGIFKSRSALNSDRKSNPYIIDKSNIYNLKILPSDKKAKILQDLFLNQKNTNNSSKKNLLIQINSLNAIIFNNVLWKIKNIKKSQIYSNKLGNEKINKRDIFKQMKFDNIT